MKPHRVRLASVFLPPEHLNRDQFIIVLRRHYRREAELNEVINGPHGLRGVRQLVESADTALV